MAQSRHTSNDSAKSVAPVQKAGRRSGKAKKDLGYLFKGKSVEFNYFIYL